MMGRSSCYSLFGLQVEPRMKLSQAASQNSVLASQSWVGKQRKTFAKGFQSLCHPYWWRHLTLYHLFWHNKTLVFTSMWVTQVDSDSDSVTQLDDGKIILRSTRQGWHNSITIRYMILIAYGYDSSSLAKAPFWLVGTHVVLASRC